MNQQSIFVISPIGPVVSTAALIVLIPSLFSWGGHGPRHATWTGCQ